MSDNYVCPTCGGVVDPSWTFCQLCGFDPQGQRPPDWVPGAHRPPPFTTPPPFTMPPPGQMPPPASMPPPRRVSPPTAPSGNGGVNPVVVVGVIAVAIVAIVLASLALISNDPSPPSATAIDGTSTTVNDNTTTTAATIPRQTTIGTVDLTKWITFSAPDGTFTVDMSSNPREQHHQFVVEGQRAPVDYTEFTADQPGREAIVGYYDLPSWFQRRQNYLEDALIGALFSTDGRISEYNNLTTPEGKPAIDGVIVLKNSARLRVRFMDAGSRLYLLAYEAPLRADEEWQQFINSFRLGQ